MFLFLYIYNIVYIYIYEFEYFFLRIKFVDDFFKKWFDFLIYVLLFILVNEGVYIVGYVDRFEYRGIIYVFRSI